MAKYTKREAQEWASATLRGEWTTLMTPFTPDDRVDEQALRHNIRHIRSLGTQGGGCAWGMGEFWSLTREERLRVMDVTADEAAGRWLIAAHVTHTSYKDAQELARHAEERGFDLLVLAAPYMATKTEDQVVEFTRRVAESTSLGIMFYNSPQFGIVMSAKGLQRLCQIPNVVGVKEASFNRDLSVETHLLLGKQKLISTPDEWIYWKGKELGFNQQVMFANTSDWRFDLPGRNHYVRFVDKASRGELDTESYDLHIRPVKTVSDAWWGRTVKKFGGALPVALCKYWGELMGLRHGDPRLPLGPFTEEEKAELRRDLQAVGHPITQR